ncbi:FHA domain-containing protein [Candidatus Micrarchaeota archaeon]|nr:FHA domain-containing protein [Candidatus Micrarchaeota archaeon]
MVKGRLFKKLWEKIKRKPKPPVKVIPISEPLIKKAAIINTKTGKLKAVYGKETVYFGRKPTPHLFENDRTASRNHFKILVIEDGWFISESLNKNGTKVNGTKLIPDTYFKLNPNDIIKAGNTELMFSYEPQNAALVVGSPGLPPLRGVLNDVAQMKRELSTRKCFTGNIFDDSRVTLGVLDSFFKKLGNVLCEASTFVFYYSGHGGSAGLGLADGDLTPKDLFSYLHKLPGRKLVILDCCHSIVFTSDIPERILVLSGISPEETLFEGNVTRCVGEENASRHGYLTRAIIKYLQDHPESFSIKGIEDSLAEYRKLRNKNVKVFAEGTEIFLRSRAVDN